MRSLPILAAGLAAVSLLSATPASAAPAKLLRYHLSPGHSLLYTVAESDVADVREGTGAPQREGDTTSYQVSYDFGRLQPDGGVALRLRIDHRTVRLTKGGKTSVSHPKMSSTYFWQEPDGRQLSPNRHYTGAYSNGDLGNLPAIPVGVGSTWTSTLTDQGLLSHYGLTCHNTLARWLDPAATVAEVHTTCSMQARGTYTNHGTTYRLSGTTTLTGRWAFDVHVGRFLEQVLTQKTSEQGTATDKRGTHPYSMVATGTIEQRLIAMQ